jgi:4-hydroxy-4-methyl-2-oxoglutarate aldolase
VLQAEQLEELRRFPTPTVSNAIELFDVRPRQTGFLSHAIRSLTPEIGPVIGFAVTSRTYASSPSKSPDLTADYLRYVAMVNGPKLAVGQDLDDPPGLGAQFGEVNASIHRRLGCVGHITSGCPRDLDEVRALGFALFGLNPCVSHGYVHLVDFGESVSIRGVIIEPGDLLHADQHGVCIIPLEIASELAEACREVERRERPLLESCRAEPFELESYLSLRAGAAERIRE